MVGHPFNPPYLIPLVEIVGGKYTDPAAVAWTEKFYAHAGKVCLTMDAEVPPAVVLGLTADGIDVRAYRPRQITPELIEAVAHVVVCGCELPAFMSPPPSLECWDDLPFVSDGYEPVRSAIVERVEHLLKRLGST